jgi:hypothetical protein
MAGARPNQVGASAVRKSYNLMSLETTSVPLTDSKPKVLPSRLVLLSFLMLFLELALIRWLGANVIYLSFFSNLVLLGSFLGIGVGFLSVARRTDWIRWLPRSLLGLVGFVTVFPVQIDRLNSEVLFFGDPQPSGLPIWFTVPILFLLVVAIMAMLGQEVGRTFAAFRPLEAYRLDIAGSLLGIVAFASLSFLGSPPVVWGLATAVLVLGLAKQLRGPDRVAMAGVVLILGIQSLSPNLSWSPYYQVSTYVFQGRDNIAVNGIPHQTIFPASYLETTFYAEPYRLHGESVPSHVLIIGSGNGNDVALALAKGADIVDAVEIDPRLYQLGVELHPDAPYSDPRVHAIIDDGRAFMERTDARYDLIVFALPDSLTLVSGQSSLRLESYLFTKEAIGRARDLLDVDGTFAMYNYYREDWLVQRLARTIFESFDTAPCVISTGDVGRLALLAVGAGPSANCTTPTPDVAAAPLPATDDYPYLYVRDRGLPGLYGVTLILILGAALLLVRVSVGPLRSLRPYLDLLAMGAAFLLLETKSVVQFALWFGTTWMVNALVFAGVLVSVLAAIELARRIKLPRSLVLYGALLLALMVAWSIPVHALLELPTALRWVSATAITFSPIFLANLIFAQRFAATSSATAAFGANLLGAMFGGLLEYGALLVGYRALIVLVGLIYLAAFVLTPKKALALS